MKMASRACIERDSWEKRGNSQKGGGPVKRGGGKKKQNMPSKQQKNPKISKSIVMVERVDERGGKNWNKH